MTTETLTTEDKARMPVAFTETHLATLTRVDTQLASLIGLAHYGDREHESQESNLLPFLEDIRSHVSALEEELRQDMLMRGTRKLGIGYDPDTGNVSGYIDRIIIHRMLDEILDRAPEDRERVNRVLTAMHRDEEQSDGEISEDQASRRTLVTELARHSTSREIGRDFSGRVNTAPQRDPDH